MEEHFTMSRQAMFCETLCLCLFLGTKWIHRHKQPGDLDNSDNLDNLDTIWTIQTITFGFFASTTTFGFFASTASRCPPHAFHEPSAGLDGTVDGASGGVCLSQLDLPVCTIVQRTRSRLFPSRLRGLSQRRCAHMSPYPARGVYPNSAVTCFDIYSFKSTSG